MYGSLCTCSRALRKRVNCEGTTIYYYSEWAEDLKQRNSTAGLSEKQQAKKRKKENYPFGVQVIRKKNSKKRKEYWSQGSKDPGLDRRLLEQRVKKGLAGEKWTLSCARSTGI